MASPRDNIQFVSPTKQVNAGLWTLFVGATLFLGLRLWCKYTRRTGLWYDDYVLVLSWLVLMATDIIITYEYATGYVVGNWDDRMHILINISSCGTLVGQALSKTALGLTLLRLSNKKQLAILWICIITMNVFMIVKVFFQWAKYCGKADYQSWYRIQGPCINYNTEQKIKVGGNSYNILMDFIFALFPWWITWSLEMRKVEKIALCTTMSLGMIVAIVSAIRTSWQYRPIMNVHDEYYIWRNGMSNIWYSAEVAGTIIVQCIPILRPLFREIHTTMTSRKLSSTEDGLSTSWQSRRSTMDAKRGSIFVERDDNGKRSNGKKGMDVMLCAIPEELRETQKNYYPQSILSEVDQSMPPTPAKLLPSYLRQSVESERTDRHSLQSESWLDMEQHERKGLYPSPPRAAYT